MTQSRRKLDPKAQTVIRLWVGLGFLAVGLFQILAPPSFPPGDVRSTSGLWPLIGGVAATIGIAILVSTIVARIRKR